MRYHARGGHLAGVLLLAEVDDAAYPDLLQEGWRGASGGAGRGENKLGESKQSYRGDQSSRKGVGPLTGVLLGGVLVPHRKVRRAKTNAKRARLTALRNTPLYTMAKFLGGYSCH